MFNRARSRNTKIWSVDGLNTLVYGGFTPAMLQIESDRNSMNTPMIENIISVAEDEETRILARLAANLTLETAKLDQDLTLAQAGLVTERAKLALVAQEFETQLRTLEEEYDSNVAVQYAKEAAIAADRSVAVKTAEVGFQRERLNLEAREVDLRVQLEEIEQEQASIDVSRAENQVSELKIEISEDEIKRQEIDLQISRFAIEKKEADNGILRALLDQEEIDLEDKRLALQALEIIYQRNVEDLAQRGYKVDLEDVGIARVASEIDLFMETYNQARVDLEVLSYANDKLRFEIRGDAANLQGKEIELRGDTLLAEERELRARIVELGAQAKEIEVPKKRLEMAEARSQFEIDRINKEIKTVGRRELISKNDIEKRADILQQEIANINDRVTRLGEMLVAQTAHQDFRFVLAELQALEPIRRAEERKVLAEDDANLEESLVVDRIDAAAKDTNKRIEVNDQRREEAFLDNEAAVGAAELYAKAVVTTNLIQSISSS
jgi:hypothetical protein